GIGTASPTQKLDVRGSINVSSDVWINNGTSLAAFVAYNQTQSAYFYNQTALSGSGANTYVPYWTAAKTLSGEAAFIYDASNNRLNITASSAVATGIYSSGYVEDVSGIMDGNYVPSHSWTVGTNGSVGIFTLNGETWENSREWGTGPFWNRAILWEGAPDGLSGNADGGWNTAYFPVNINKTYRFSVWVKKTGINSGSTYLGTGGTGADVQSLAGVNNSNPYFWSSTLPATEKWYLIVGYVHAHSDTSTESFGGVYDGETGKKVSSATDFKMQPGLTGLRHRAYLYYSNNTGTAQYFWDPRVEEINGKEPTIEALLGIPRHSGYGSTWGPGANVGVGHVNPAALGNTLVVNGTVSFLNATAGQGLFQSVAANVGIGTGTPASKLDIDTGSNSLGLRLRGLAETTEIADIFVGASGRLVLSTANTGGSASYIEIDPEDDQFGLIIRDANTGSSQYANLYMTDAANDYLHLVVNSATASTTGLVINDKDYVGIGTTAPRGVLDVQSANYANLTVDTTSTGNATIFIDRQQSASESALVLQDGGADNWRIGTMGTSLSFRNISGNSNVFFQQSGNVGIGTTSPAYRFEINAANNALNVSNFLLVNSTSLITGARGVNINNRGGIVQTQVATPKEVGYLQDDSAGGTAASMNSSFSVYVSGNYAYVVSDTEDSLTIVDISIPTNPKQVGVLIDNSLGGTATSLNKPNSIYVAGDYAYIGSYSDNTLTIVNVSDPAHPSEVGAVAAGAAPRDVYVSGKYAYVVGISGSILSIVDVSNPESPRVAGSITDSGSTHFATPNAVYVSGSYAYIASQGDDALAIIDVSNPKSPVQIGSVRDNSAGGTATTLDIADAVYVSGSYAYVLSGGDHGMSIINISDPTNPREVGSIRDGVGSSWLNTPRSVYVAGKYAYVVSEGDDAMNIIDVSNPASPVLVTYIQDSESGGTATVLDQPRSIHISGKYAYVASVADSGLSIIDLAGIDSPVANIGSLSVDSLDVTDSIDLANDLYVKGGIHSGSGGIYSRGGIYSYVSSPTATAVAATFMGGSVGIGTTSPTAALEVIGSGNVTGKFDVVGNTETGQGGLSVIGTTSSLSPNTDSSTLLYLSSGEVTTAVFDGSDGDGAKIAFQEVGSDDFYLYLDKSQVGLENTKIWSVLSAPIIFGTANTERMRIGSDGKVGIGTSSPNYKLEVSGNVSLNNSLYVTTSGNVGIGTASPTGKLDVAGNVNITGGRLSITGGQDTAGNIKFTNISNPYITASSYIVMPGGLYVSGGTLYAQNQLMARAGIRNDQTKNTTYESQQGLGFNIDYDNNDADTTYFSWNKNAANFGGGTELMRLSENGILRINDTIGVAAGKDLILNSTTGSGNVVIVLG
ncbi:MAG: hypothetical protein Q8Q31_02155, partial [Nanoarchaeota archaeon]|nr:hypothetical protein [Nanoarchaeota archaeon]